MKRWGMNTAVGAQVESLIRFEVEEVIKLDGLGMSINALKGVEIL